MNCDLLFVGRVYHEVRGIGRIPRLEVTCFCFVALTVSVRLLCSDSLLRTPIRGLTSVAEPASSCYWCVLGVLSRSSEVLAVFQ